MIRRLFLLVALTWASISWGAQTLVVLGDSIGAGYGLPREAGWVSLLERRLATEHPHYRVVNASISGETTLGGRDRIEGVLKTHRPALVIVELGGNDGLRGAPIETIRSNLVAIVRASTKFGARVLLVGMRLPPNYGASYTRRFAEMFSEVARDEKASLVPFLFEGFGDRQELFQADGIHPARAAQPVMLETVWKGLAPLLGKVR